MLTTTEQILGRSERADYEITVPSVSRQHAAVWMADGIPHIKDLGSGHGTFVNSTRISDSIVLRQGDLISLGQDVVLLLSAVANAEIDALDQAQFAQEDSVDSSLVELALTDTAPDSRYKAYLETLQKLREDMRGLSDPKEFLACVVGRLPEVIACDRFLVLTGETPETLEITSRKLRKPDDAAHWQAPSKSILRRGMLSDKPVIAFDAQTDKRFKGRQSIALSNVRSAICVAMRSAEGPQGVLYADTLANAGLHSIEDGNFMMLVGCWLGSQLREVRLTRDLDQTTLDLEKTVTSMIGVVTADINSHLNRLEMIADDAENERKQPGLANLLRAEYARLRAAVDEHLHWSQDETTNPGVENINVPQPRTRNEDDEDRRMGQAGAPVEKAAVRKSTVKLEDAAIVDDLPIKTPSPPDLPSAKHPSANIPPVADIPPRPSKKSSRSSPSPGSSPSPTSTRPLPAPKK